MGDITVEPGKFTVNEKVYVPHTDKYYEAKILKTEFRGQNGWFYFLHYNGWNKKYDEWVEETGLVKAEEAEAAGAIAANASKKKPTAGGGAGYSASAAKSSLVTAGGPAAYGLGRGKGGGAAGVTQIAPVAAASMGNFMGGVVAGRSSGALGPGLMPVLALDIEIPPLIKKVLVDDYECVVEGSRVVPLPRSPCISELLELYVQEAKDLRGGSCDAEEEVCHGLQSYFDKTLLAVLLYRNERGQAAHALADGRQPSAVYGAEHLCRLLVKINDIMPIAALTQDQQSTLAAMLQDVITWIVDHHATLFLPKDQYVPTSGSTQQQQQQQQQQLAQQQQQQQQPQAQMVR